MTISQSVSESQFTERDGQHGELRHEGRTAASEGRALKSWFYTYTYTIYGEDETKKKKENNQLLP